MPLTFLATPVTWLVSAAIVLLTVWLSWLGWRKSGYSPRIGLLEALRVVIVTMVAITFNQPEWLTSFQPTDRPTLLVLVDESTSMDTQDVVVDGIAKTRREFVEPLLSEQVWAKAEETLDVVVEKFSSQLDVPKAGTDMSYSLAAGMKNHENLRGVVLLSDGDWNVGDPPANIAGRLRLNKSPIYSIVAGSESKLPDVVLERFDAPTFGVVSKPMRLPFVVSSSLPRAIQTKISLEVSTGEKVSKDILIPAMGTIEDS